jgi:hypothetical protein
VTPKEFTHLRFQGRDESRGFVLVGGLGGDTDIDLPGMRENANGRIVRVGD